MGGMIAGSATVGGGTAAAARPLLSNGSANTGRYAEPNGDGSLLHGAQAERSRSAIVRWTLLISGLLGLALVALALLNLLPQCLLSEIAGHGVPAVSSTAGTLAGGRPDVSPLQDDPSLGESEATLAKECISVWPQLCKFVDPLPVPPTLDAATWATLTVGAYKIHQKLHRDLPPTPMYGFGTSADTASSPGPTFLATRGVPTTVQWVNNITDADYMIPVDKTLMWADPQRGGVPIVPHLHGGETESASDGHPDAWWTHGGEVGPTFEKSLYSFANRQEPATLWYHDHVLGVTRISVYLGLAGVYILRDPLNMEANLTLPRGEFDLPILVQDKQLKEDGTLDFPLFGINPRVHPHWVPKFFGNIMTVNGKAWPYKEAQKQPYRLRLINGCNARYMNLTFIVIPGKIQGPRLSVHLPLGPYLPFHQISSDGGYLNEPISMQWIHLGPGERGDIVVDFSTLEGDENTVYVRQNSHNPNPKVDPDTDDNSLLMKFFVRAAPDSSHASEGDGDRRRRPGPRSAFRPYLTKRQALPPGQTPRAKVHRTTIHTTTSDTTGANGPLTTGQKLPPRLNFIPAARPAEAVRTRWLFMREYSEMGLPAHSLLGGKKWRDPVTETPREGTTEIWNIINLTTGPHLMHFHLTPHRVLSRHPFNLMLALAGGCSLPSLPNEKLPSCFIEEPQAPHVNELGWKDTTDMKPGHVTSILFEFTKQNGEPFPFNATQGPGYVWHCHSLDHEDNEMMRPIQILPAVLNE